MDASTPPTEFADSAALAYFNNPKRGGLLIQVGPIFWVLFCGAILAAAIAAGTWLIIDRSRSNAIQTSQNELENTALLLARHFDRQIRDFEAVQDSFASKLDGGVGSVNNFRQLLSTTKIHDLLRAKVTESLEVSGVNIFDADGNYINSSERWPVPALNISDRGYFRAFKSGSTPSPLMIEVVQSRLSNHQKLILARRITNSQGEFVGVVTRSVPPQIFEDFLSSVVLKAGASIALHHTDGTIIARYPHVNGLVGRSVANVPVFSQMLATDFHSAVLKSPIDGQERLVSSHLLASYPLLIVATAPIATILADWRVQTSSLLEAAFLTAIVLCLMVLFITRHLKSQHRRLDVAVTNMKQALLLFDDTERLTVCNKRYLEMFGLSSDIVKPGISFRDIIQHRRDTGTYLGDVDEYCDSIREALKTGNGSEGTIETPDGRWMQINNRPLPEGGWVATIEDVTEQRLSEQTTEYLATFDPLTDLPNRTSFLRHLDAELRACSTERPLAVLFLDIDEFKNVNDTLGHHVGDQLLRSFAKQLQSSLEEGEFVARIGGDEFAIASSGLHVHKNVLQLVQRIYNAIRQRHQCGAHEVLSDSSIGIAIAPQDGADCDQILQNADLAMYEAKSLGRRTYRFFEKSMETRAKERLLLEADLRKAIADERLDVYYQPIVSLIDNHIVGCEALVRWTHDERGSISPADFIPLAEKSGLIHDLGNFVLRKACAEAAGWPASLTLAVNVSPVQLRSDTFSLKVISALAKSGLAATRLELEITEAALIDDDDAALKILHQLREIGVRIALDDFGTGYSSLSYLRRFPFDKIKIDRSFVDDLSKPDGSPAIIKAVVAIAEERNMVTTAEGVETDEQREKLCKLGCSEMQGFLFSRPQPAALLRELLGDSKSQVAQRAG